jgi:phosphate transport system substrate-binding protein
MKALFKLRSTSILFAAALLTLQTPAFCDFKASGSDSTFSVVKALFEGFEAKTGIHVEYSGGGSSHGAKSCISQDVELGFLSRKLKPSEIDQGLTGHAYAIDGVAIIVSPRNPVDSVTMEELSGMFSGETGWSDGRPTVLFNRNAESGTREVFKNIVPNGKAFSPQAKILHDQLMIRNIGKIPTAIGYTSASSIHPTVKTLSIGGIDPSPANLLSGAYPITRTLTFATRTDSGDEVKQFIDFALSQEGSAIIQASGFLPLNSQSYLPNKFDTLSHEKPLSQPSPLDRFWHAHRHHRSQQLCRPFPQQ